MVAVVVLTAYFVGNRLSKNVYDALIGKYGVLCMDKGMDISMGMGMDGICGYGAWIWTWVWVLRL